MATTKPRAARANILISVLWVIVILAVIVLGLNFEARSDVERTISMRNRAKAYWMARGASERAKYEFAAQKVQDSSGLLPDPDQQRRFVFDFQEGQAHVALESSLSLMSVHNTNREMWKKVLSVFDLDDHERDRIIDAVIDWQDQDDLIQLNGAEADYYQTLDPPYVPRNERFQSTEELLLVRGITQDIFYGQIVEGQMRPGLKDIVSVDGSKSSKFDINSATQAVLMAFLETDAETAQNIIAYREENPVQSLDDISQFLDGTSMDNLNQYFITYRGNEFRIRATAMIYDSHARYTVEDEVRYMGGARLFSVQSHKDFSTEHVGEENQHNEEDER